MTKYSVMYVCSAFERGYSSAKSECCWDVWPASIRRRDNLSMYDERLVVA
jgi:hypothetical protein